MAQPTVASLCRALGADLRPAPGFTAPAREVSAVHISELPDPTGYLAGGELLLSTGLALPLSRLGCDRYVSRLVAAGVSALALGLGPVHDDVPPVLARACAGHGLPLLVVPAPTPFLRVTTAFWKAASRSSEQRLRDVVAAQQAVVDAAASADPEVAVLRTISRSLGGWAASFRPGGDLGQVVPRRFTGQASVVRDELQRLEGAGVHSAASMSTGSSTVVVYPLAVKERVVGHLAVGTTGPLDQPRRRLVLTAVAILSLEAVRLARADTAADEAERCVGLLVDQGSVSAARELAAAVAVPVPGARLRVLGVEGDDPRAIIEAARRWCPSVIAVRSGARSAWLLVPQDHPPADTLARTLSRAAPRSVAVMSETTPVTAVGPVRARTVAALARLAPGTRLLEPADAGGYDHVAVQRLGAGLDRLDDTLVGALAGYLRHRGQWESAARDLGVHRNTLRHRIRRCEAALDVDLADPDTASELWLLLRRRALA